MSLLSSISRAALLLTLPCWMACQGNNAKQETTAATTAAIAPAVAAPPALTEAQALAQRFGPLLRGTWVNADYLAEVSKTKSPLLAADKVGEVSEIDISLTGQAGDSLAVSLGLGNHEGTDMIIYFRPGLQALSLPTNYRDFQVPGNFTEISCQPGPRDTLLVLTTYSKARKIVRRAAFRRVPAVPIGKLEGLNTAVNSLLFAGRYTGLDSLGQPVQLQFTPDGRVQGLPGFRTYYTSTDFGGGPGNDIDNITFDHHTKHARLMGYERRADILRLFATHLVFDQDSLETLVRGRVLYTLKRR